MCGIFCYANFLTKRTKKEISDILINGLRRIEYRGYDSAGFAIQNASDKKFLLFKETGKVNSLCKLVEEQTEIDMNEGAENHVGIAHTRWATHGMPSVENTHPLRSDKNGKFLCVHNGIITNFKELKVYLESKNFKFESDTDTEVAAKLALLFYNDSIKKGKSLSFVEIVKKVVKNCQGAFAFVFVSTLFPNEMVAVRKSSPLLIGIRTFSKITLDFLDVSFGTLKDDKTGSVLMDEKSISPMNSTEDLRIFESFNLHNTDLKNNQMEIFMASDASAIIEHTKKVIYLEEDDIAHVCKGNLHIHRPNTAENDSVKKNTREVQTIETEIVQIMKGNYDHFMLKEIFEQPESIVNTMRGRINFKTNDIVLGGLKSYIRSIKKSSRLIFIACGTSYHSCLANRSIFEELVDIPVQVEIGSDFIDRSGIITRSDCCFFVSQSGETADTISALRYCQERGSLCIGITNTVGSTISRETNCGIHINAGPEISVASTKAYTSQYVSLILIALMLSQDNLIHRERRVEIIDGLKNINLMMQKTLKLSNTMAEFAKKELADERHLIILGRGYQHATCLEGALKIKELTYMPTEGILAGELKHGSIALIDDNSKILFVISNDKDLNKVKNSVHQILSRGGHPIIVCTENLVNEYKDFKCIPVPSTVDCLQGLISVIPMQLLAYHMAVLKGHDVDCPRNLAKSVTVE